MTYWLVLRICVSVPKTSGTSVSGYELNRLADARGVFPKQVMLTLANGATVEVGVIGIDGVIGLPILLGAESMPGETFIQVSASGFRIDAQRLKSEFERNGKLRDHLQKYLLANLIQSAQNAAASPACVWRFLAGDLT